MANTWRQLDDWHEATGWTELLIDATQQEITIEILATKSSGDFHHSWIITDGNVSYDSGFQFETHGQALDDALLFWQEWTTVLLYKELGVID